MVTIEELKLILGGIVLGFLLTLGCIFIFIYKLVKKNDDKDKAIKVTTDNLGEEYDSEKDDVLFENALKFLRGEPIDKDDEIFPTEEKAPLGTTQQMEKCFCDSSRDAKDRQKHVRSLNNFFSDYSKITKGYCKDLAKLSQTAESYVKAENDKYLDKWWNALSIAMDHLSQDQEFLADLLEHDICYNLNRVFEEHSHLERQLNGEGNKQLQRIKEAISTCESRTKDRDKLREKLNIAVDKSNQSSSTASASSESTKLTIKLTASEATLQDAINRLAGSQQEYNEKMPRILGDFRLMTSNSTSSMRELLLKLADIVMTTHMKSNQVMQRLKMDLASSTKQEESNSYDSALKEVLEKIAQGQGEQLDMSLESTAGLAASLLSRVPDLPQRFSETIGKETAIWFNAFSGRIYRDTARSAYFHNWFRQKVGNMLNKGHRPGYVDEFVVGDVKFGSLPPLLCNMQWTPVRAANGQDPEYDVACTADMAFRSGLKFTVTTRLWLNWPRDRFAFIPIVINLEVSEFTGRIRFGVNKRNSFLSFVGEPYSRFTVHSEVGSQYKLKNIPKLSSVVITKIKNHIRKKLIYPNAYKFRLVWPKNWWPEEDSPTSGTAATAAPSSTSGATDTTKSTETTKDSVTPTSTDHGLSSSTVSRATDGSDSQGGISVGGLHSHEDQSNVLSPTDRKQQRLIDVDVSSVRESIVKWFPRFKYLKNDNENTDESGGGDGDGDGDGDEEIEARWKAIVEVAKKYVTDGMDSRPFHELPVTRSSCTTTELTRRSEYPHIKDIFAPLETSSTQTVLPVRRVRRAFSIGDFRPGSLDDMLVARFLHQQSDLQSGLTHDNFEMNSISAGRAFDDTDAEYRSRLHWLSKLKNQDRPKLASTLLELKARLTKKMVNAEDRPQSISAKSIQPSRSDAANATTRDRTFSLFTQLETVQQPTPLVQKIIPRSSLSFRTSEVDHSSAYKSSPNSNGMNVSLSTAAGSATSRSGALKNIFFQTKEAIKKGISKTVDRSRKGRSGISAISCVSYQPEDAELDDDSSHSEVVETNTTELNSDSKSKGKNNLHDQGDVTGDERRRVSSTKINESPKAIGKSMSGSSGGGGGSGGSGGGGGTGISRVGSVRDANGNIVGGDLEQEAMTLAWEARAEAISKATEDGQQPSMQGFLRTPLRTSVKMWVVLRSGYLGVFADPADCQNSVPRSVYTLEKCLCRPLDQAYSFELGTTDDQGRIKWHCFWAETDVQCKAWVMAVQHSANLPNPVSSEVS